MSSRIFGGGYVCCIFYFERGFMPIVIIDCIVVFEWAMAFCDCETFFFAASQSVRDSSRSFRLRFINSVEDCDCGMAGLPSAVKVGLPVLRPRWDKLKGQ
jgi:hypothetical protein